MEAQILLGSKITSLHETSLQYIPNQLGQNVKGFKQSPRHRELRCKSRKPKSSTKRKLLVTADDNEVHEAIQFVP
ncbi:uncharacterized protein LOC114265845 isoform X3 [Camellia sinensis]|uniref:uncharacterized protein LOC114265845 isoform X3 n=1 Tax=Camellia sinensis TaxID=4442 RepID=UPI001036BB92|nr:uncharacterized protein LOC114265845 isoform X3 [Camellia sinensis]